MLCFHLPDSTLLFTVFLSKPFTECKHDVVFESRWYVVQLDVWDGGSKLSSPGTKTYHTSSGSTCPLSFTLPGVLVCRETGIGLTNVSIAYCREATA